FLPDLNILRGIQSSHRRALTRERIVREDTFLPGIHRSLETERIRIYTKSCRHILSRDYWHRHVANVIVVDVHICRRAAGLQDRQPCASSLRSIVSDERVRDVLRRKCEGGKWCFDRNVLFIDLEPRPQISVASNHDSMSARGCDGIPPDNRG